MNRVTNYLIVSGDKETLKQFDKQFKKPTKLANIITLRNIKTKSCVAEYLNDHPGAISYNIEEHDGKYDLSILLSRSVCNDYSWVNFVPISEKELMSIPNVIVNKWGSTPDIQAERKSEINMNMHDTFIQNGDVRYDELIHAKTYIEQERLIKESNEPTLLFSFFTVNAAPLLAVKAAAKQYPSLKFTLKYNIRHTSTIDGIEARVYDTNAHEVGILELHNDKYTHNHYFNETEITNFAEQNHMCEVW